MMKVAFITGIAGQDGSYLSELLVNKGYQVHGLISEGTDLWRLENIANKLHIYTDNTNSRDKLKSIFKKVLPDEIYHLASTVDARVNFDSEKDIFNNNFLMGYDLLRLIKEYKSTCKIYFSGSSLMFGEPGRECQSESTPMLPTTPYGIAKVTLFNFIQMYRDTYKIHACMGILYNHESIRRDYYFLPRKITRAAARIKLGKDSSITLGDINVSRDWSYAGDIVESMWLMLQTNQPKDYVVGSGLLHSVKELLEIAFNEVDLNWKDYVEIDESLIRNVEYKAPCANSNKIYKELGWKAKVEFGDLIKSMVLNDISIEKK